MERRFRKAVFCALSICVISSDALYLVVPGSFCVEDGDCDPFRTRLACRSPNGGSSSICTCPEEAITWNEDRRKCLNKAGGSSNNDEQRKREEEVAKVVTILVPILGACFAIGCVAFMCCYWIQASADLAKKEASKRDTYDPNKIEFEDDDDDDDFVESDDEEPDPVHREKSNPRKKKGKGNKNGEKEMTSIVPPQDANEAKVAETAFTKATNGGPPKNTLENGYQASMRQFLTFPEMRSEPQIGTRPLSANVLSLSRPGTAVRLNSAYSPRRVNSAIANGSKGKPGAVFGPYVTDVAAVARARAISPRPPKPPSPPTNQGSIWPKPGDIADLYQKVAEEEDKKEEDEDETPLEEIKLVRAAVNAFKKRRNMKKVKEEQKKRRGKRLENLVDQILKQRQKEKSNTEKSKSQAKNSKNSTRRGSKSSDSSRSATSASSRGPLLGPDGRVESVAARVKRERQVKKIRARVPVTPPRSSRPDKAKPLHVALRAASAKHLSKAQVKQRIQQQVHLNAVRSYRAPSITTLEKGPPIKSILKKNMSNGYVKTSDLPNGEKKGVNYKIDNETPRSDETVTTVKAEVYTISS